MISRRPYRVLCLQPYAYRYMCLLVAQLRVAARTAKTVYSYDVIRLNRRMLRAVRMRSLDDASALKATRVLRMRQQPLEYPSVRYWSKGINGTLTGG